jgi:Na+/H+-dicarboxylate symporter
MAATGTANGSARLFRRVLMALAGGVLTGLFLGDAVWPLKGLSDVFVKMLQVTVLPYVLGSVMAGLGSQQPSEAGKLAVRGSLLLLLVWASALLIVGASSFAYPAGRSAGVFVGDLPPPEPIDWIELYIPSNVFRSLAFNIMPAVVLFGILAGVSLSGMAPERKRPLLEVVEAFNEAMGRISRGIIHLTPIGLFAMCAAAAGTMRIEEFVRLQVWFVVFVGAACLLAFWLLPALVALLTPIRYGRFLATLQTAMLTAFAAGDYFVVLPMIAEANKQLLAEQGCSEDDANRTIGVVVPLLFNFPHAGKVLSLAFVPFGAWFSGVDLSPVQWVTLGTAGLLSMFGNINAAMPFVLDLLRLPADLFNLFTMSSVVNARFGALVATMHTASLSMLVAAGLLGLLRVNIGRLAKLMAGGALVLAAYFGGTRLLFEHVVPPPPSGLAALEGFVMRHGTPPPPVRAGDAPVEAPGPAAARLDAVRARGVMRVGFFTDAVPYVFYNPEGQLVGFDVEMAHALARELGVSVEFVPIRRTGMAAALDAGICDIVMSGVVVTVPTAMSVTFSHGYREERVGFLVPDYRRGEFLRLDEVRPRPLRLGVLSERFTAAVQRRLPAATIVPGELGTLIDTGDLHGLDGYVLPMDQAYYIARLQPAFDAVLPEDDRTFTVLAYAMPRGAESFRELVNTWIEVTRSVGLFDDAHGYWVRGRALESVQPRWSLGRDVLGWW